MTDTHTTLERLKSDNAVPSTDSLPSSALSSVDLLARIDERSTGMTETNTVTYPDSPQPPKRGRGPLLALAVAAAVLLVGVLGLLAANRNEVEPAQIVPTTEAVPTTAAAPDYSAARETLDTWAVAIGAGDIDAAMATTALIRTMLRGVVKQWHTSARPFLTPSSTTANSRR
jgi:hypothetical protein